MCMYCSIVVEYTIPTVTVAYNSRQRPETALHNNFYTKVQILHDCTSLYTPIYTHYYNTNSNGRVQQSPKARDSFAQQH